ncbi:MAG: ASKHA domain-containing protein [Spirochaetaceae bacterium]|jgi:uncharacterized 2Fe-2S/4Fe-4S cluster protein (DUF4445 family)|nr:ASKHA domain-containing protein [Spirochaetaceae bacterium]
MAKYGIALDLGTTNLEAALVDMEGGAVLEQIIEANSQKLYGRDVMTRINASCRGKGEQLCQLIKGQTGQIIRYFAEKYAYTGQFYRLLVAGNTTMINLFMHADVTGLSHVPFTAEYLDYMQFTGDKMGYPLHNFCFLPSLSAFFGADVLGGLMILTANHANHANNTNNTNKNWLFMDLGTNAEMAVYDGKNNQFFCSSAAAGPVFENFVDEKGDMMFGSQLIDEMARLLDEEIIDESGKLLRPAQNDKITQKKVRDFQLAKGAIAAGIEILLKEAGLAKNAIDAVYVAGNLGNNLNAKSALRTGLIPAAIGKTVEDAASSIQACGNLSLKAAITAVLDDSFGSRCEELRSRCKAINLAEDPAFSDLFVDNMGFE